MDEIAELTGVTAAEVQGTCSFYTMFKRRPCGKLVVSVCTNVTCLVTGGPEILEHLEAHYATDPDVTVEEVECLAACGGAPVDAGQLRVPREAHARDGAQASGRGVPHGHAPGAHDLGIGGVTLIDHRDGASSRKRLHERPDDSWTIDGALASGAYETLRAVLAKGDPADVQEQVKVVGPARPRRRQLLDRPEVVVPARPTCSRATSW